MIAFTKWYCAIRAAEESAIESADFLGNKGVIKKSWGYNGGQMSRNYSDQEEHKIKPYLL